MIQFFEDTVAFNRFGIWTLGIAYFNDLHKGRNTGLVWKLFIDLVAGACVFFALTGLVLLWIQARQRTSTWPLVSLGVAVLVVLMILFAH